MKIKNVLLAFLFGMLTIGALKADTVFDVINQGNNGTTSATVIVPQGEGMANITDLSVRLDSGVTTGIVSIDIAKTVHAITSATAASASVFWFDNAASDVAVSGFIIFLDQSTGTYYLRKVSAASTTSCTTYSSVPVATLATYDKIWSCLSTIQKPVFTNVSATLGSSTPGIWLPSTMPVAFTVDGNTTSCRITLSGIRTRSTN